MVFWILLLNGCANYSTGFVARFSRDNSRLTG
jgi:hypothetical protein